MLVVKKLREDVELLAEELIREIDSGVHDSRSVSPYGVGNMADVDGIEVLTVRCSFNKNLQMERSVRSYSFSIQISHG